MRILRSRQDLIQIYQPQNTWSSKYHLRVPFALYVTDTADVWVFYSVASALLWRVSKQKRFQLFSFNMWSYIIPGFASVTPPSVLRNGTISCGNGRFFSTQPNEVLHSLEVKSHGNSTFPLWFPFSPSLSQVPPYLCHPFLMSSLVTSLPIASSILHFLLFRFSPQYFMIRPVEVLAAWVLFQHANNRVGIDYLSEIQWQKDQTFSTHVFHMETELICGNFIFLTISLMHLSNQMPCISE